MAISWLTDTSPPHGLAEPDELHITQSESWSNDKISTQVELKVAWNERYDVLHNLLTSGKRWPYHASNTCIASSGSIVPFPGQQGTRDGGGYIYDYAKLTVVFESLSATEGEETTIYSESIEPTLEFQTLPPSQFRWGSGSGDELLPEEAPGRLQVGLDYVVTLYNLPSIPTEAVTLIGKSNSGTVTSASLGLTFAAETLLFNPPKISRNVAFGSSNRYTMQTRFTCKPSGWNKFWRSSTQAYESIYVAGGSEYKNFPPASFANMLP